MLMDYFMKGDIPKKFGERGVDIGAEDDLAEATKLIYNAVVEYGMDEELSNVNLSNIL
jgi:ATP-dependent Zn protease